MGLYSKAEPLYQRAISLLEKTQPLETRGLAFAIGGLADCYASQKQYAAAEPLYRRGIALLASQEKANQRELGAMTGNLGSILSSQGRHADAQPLYSRSIEMLSKAYGPEHAVLARLYHEQAGMYQEHEPALAGAGGLRKGARDPREAAGRRDGARRDPASPRPGLRGAEPARRREATLERALEDPGGAAGAWNELVASARRDYEKVAVTP